MLWVGWFGFNAGSELAADGVSGMAMFVTQIATAAAALTWTFAEWARHGKPSALGIASGAVGGLVAITPAAGFVGPGGAMVIGIVAGFGCFWGATTLKKKMGYDDSLDCFGVHGIGGIIGALLTGVFVAESLGGSGLAEGMTMLGQLWVQFYAVVATVIYDAIATLIILKALDAIIGLRVDEEQESEGLDLALHGERGYTL
jgi:Amt family ammonium transporter